jgi:hypothetical protein
MRFCGTCYEERTEHAHSEVSLDVEMRGRLAAHELLQVGRNAHKDVDCEKKWQLLIF